MRELRAYSIHFDLFVPAARGAPETFPPRLAAQRPHFTRIGAEWRNHEQNEQAQTDTNMCEGWTKLWSGGGALAVARWGWSGGGALAVARWW